MEFDPGKTKKNVLIFLSRSVMLIKKGEINKSEVIELLFSS